MNVLIVDDELTNRIILSEMLTISGHKVFEVESGFSALETLTELEIDIILLDVMMPDMDGFETASKIRQLDLQKYIPIIYVTALSDSHRLSYGLTWGDDFLLKPVDQELLIDRINNIYSNFEVNNKLRKEHREMKLRSEQVMQEHVIVEEIFEKIIKNNTIDGNRVKYIVTPMSILSGDVVLCRCLSNKTYLLLGDFTGHGLPAAMGIIPTARIFFDMTKKGSSTADIASEINKALINYLPDYMFLAANLIEIDHDKNKATIWSGAMDDIIQTNSNGQIKNLISSQHMPLGVLEESEFNNTCLTHDYEQDDRLYLYTDGVTEATSINDEFFGSERLKSLFNNEDPHLFQHIINSVFMFTQGKEQADDISLVEITLN